MKYYINKYKFFICITILFIFTVLFLVIKNENSEAIIIENNELESSKEIVDKIKVDIKGMVENSGVYELDAESRVIDAINIAGGLSDGANTSYLNLSKKLKDGDVIIVYSNDYIESLKKENIVYVELPCECPDAINDACIENEIVNETLPNTKDTLISINIATKEELMTLPGVGESKAVAIIKYREENNGFQTLEEIMNVSGIGEAAYSKIKDYIKL